MRISELARRTGVSTDALRHYEKLGLLRPDRLANGYRDYPESLRREVVFIAMSRQIGFSLPAIAERLPLYRTGKLGFDAMVQALAQRVAEIDAQLAALQAQRAQVVEHIAWMHAQKQQWQARQAAAPAGKPWPRSPQRKETPR